MSSTSIPVPELSFKQKALFWSKVHKAGPDKCWPWAPSVASSQYGRMGLGRKTFLAHRISWTLAFGNFDWELLVLHKCDNPPCVNPAHLFLGTQADNLLDRNVKGRAPEHYSKSKPEVVPKGQKHWNSKLTDEQVKEIRVLRKSGWKLRELAEKYNVSKGSISYITTDKTRKGEEG